MRRAMRNLAVAAVATGLLIGPGAIGPSGASGATAPAE